MNKEEEIAEYRKNVTNKYVNEVMEKFDEEKKLCSCCNRMKPLHEYYKHPINGTITDICKNCIRRKQKTYERSIVCKKTCKCCGRTKPLTAFYKNPLKKEKVTDVCKECLKRRQKNYRKKLKNI